MTVLFCHKARKDWLLLSSDKSLKGNREVRERGTDTVRGEWGNVPTQWIAALLCCKPVLSTHLPGVHLTSSFCCSEDRRNLISGWWWL